MISGSGTFLIQTAVANAARAITTVGSIDQSAASQHHDRSRDRARRRRGYARDERGEGRSFRVLLEVGRGKNGKQKTGEKCGPGRNHGAGKPGHEVSDESGGNHDRARA